MLQHYLADNTEVLHDTPEEIARELFIVDQIGVIPTLLEVLCETTGMRFAAIARVTEKTWIACAVKDDLDFGLKPGSVLDVETTLCIESIRFNQPIVIDHASADPKYCNHRSTKTWRIESYVSMPIVLANGRHFGSLFALDPTPAKVSDAKIVGMFKRFAALIAMQIDSETAHARDHTALRDERTSGELREQFIAILGHDLRNPLQAVYANSELIEKTFKDPALAAMTGRIKANVKRMSALIDDVLDFARGRLGGGIGVDITETSAVADGVNAVVKELQDGHPERQILADINVRSIVRCDLGRLQQVTSNLIGNALTHGALHSPVRVTAFADDRHLTLEVWNAGEPIPLDSVDKIFEPFWRHSTSGDRQGLGLGLHICSQIVRAHGGTLSVTSTKDAGTKFTARVPLHPLS